MTERLIPFDLQAAKDDPSRVRYYMGDSFQSVTPTEVRFAGDWVLLQFGHCVSVFRADTYADLRLTEKPRVRHYRYCTTCGSVSEEVEP